jgi:pyridoxal phosphate enzyme (YggS family)
VGDTRVEELSERLAALRERIAAACRAVGRAPDGVTLVAVTKTYPADDVVRLAGLGVTDVGENRDQEAAAKAAEVAAARAEVRWHFVGHLQRNKCRSVAGYADVVHSVDSVRLAETLGEAAHRQREGRPLEVLIQISIDGDPRRGGAIGDEFERIAESIAKIGEPLMLRGVMAVAPMTWEPAAAFEKLQVIAARLRAAQPNANWISAGMSDDLEMAVAHGSTHVRVGSALLGNRPALG